MIIIITTIQTPGESSHRPSPSSSGLPGVPAQHGDDGHHGHCGHHYGLDGHDDDDDGNEGNLNKASECDGIPMVDSDQLSGNPDHWSD